jgi:hypothetical protein
MPDGTTIRELAPSASAYSLAAAFGRTRGAFPRIGALSLLKLVDTQPGGVKFLSGKMDRDLARMLGS